MQEPGPPRRLVFHPSTRSIARFGAFRFDRADGLLARDGEEIRLPPRAPRAALVIPLALALAAGALGWLALTRDKHQPVVRLNLTRPAEQAPAPTLNAVAAGSTAFNRLEGIVAPRSLHFGVRFGS